jgi:hypothetical protein
MPLALSKWANATFSPFRIDEDTALCLVTVVFFILARLYA